MTEVTRGFCCHHSLSPGGCLPLTCGYIHLLNHEKMCIKSDSSKRFFKLATNDHSDEAFLFFGPSGLSAPAQGLFNEKVCIESEVSAIFLNLQPMIKVRRPFCFYQKHFPNGCLLLPWGYIYMYEIIRQNGPFWNWYKMMGIIKALKCCQNLYQMVVCSCPGALFQTITMG